MDIIKQDDENEACIHLCQAARHLGMDADSFEDDIAQIAIMINLSKAITARLEEICASDDYNP